MSYCKRCHHERTRIDQKKRHRANPEPFRERGRNYYRAHREEIILKNDIHIHKRRALKLGNGGTHTPEQLQDLLILQEYRCAYCGASLLEKRHLDHIVPLTRGGSNDISNLAYTCPRCNLSKNNKTLDEWRPD